MVITNVEIKELNPFADPELADNGGGYRQPKTIVRVEDKSRTYILTIVDTSCGDFGRRISKILTVDERAIFESDLDEINDKELHTYSLPEANKVLIFLSEQGYISKSELESVIRSKIRENSLSSQLQGL